jgi:hypothetical protein
MQDQSKASWASDPAIVQRSVVLEVLREDHDEWWSRSDLEAEIYDVEVQVLSEALERLRRHGVIEVDGERIRVSPSVRHLDDLGMVCI